VIDYEIKATIAASASGAPAPDVLGTEKVDGRTGIILPRYDGRSILELIARGTMSAVDAGATLAGVHADLHAGRYRANLWSFRIFVDAMAPRLAGRGVPPDVIERSREIARELPDEPTLCHGDLHFGNVLLTDNGPRIIDWTSAMSASPLVDVARQHLTLAVFHLPREYQVARRGAEESFMRTYAVLTRTTEEALRVATQPYATVMAAMRITETGCDDRERDALIEFVRSG
jgi:hypothetical protein